MKLQEKFSEWEAAMNSQFHERHSEVRGLLLALLARQNCLFLGPPGTAKSLMVKTAAQSFGLTYFSILLTRTTTPEEVFGPLSLPALEQGRYERITADKLPEAEIAFIDECYKASSAILNSLLGIMHERHFSNGGAPMPIPLQILVGASNEMPDEEDALAAFHDRFLLRFWVSTIRDHSTFHRMLLMQEEKCLPKMTKNDIYRAQAASAAVAITPSLITDIVDIRERLANEGIEASDRRWRQSLSILRAHAWLEGRHEVARNDLIALTPLLWQERSHIPTVMHVCASAAYPFCAEAFEFVPQAEEVVKNALEAEGQDRFALGVEAGAKIQELLKKTDELLLTAQKKQRPVSELLKIREQLVAKHNDVLARGLGLSAFQHGERR